MLVIIGMVVPCFLLGEADAESEQTRKLIASARQQVVSGLARIETDAEFEQFDLEQKYLAALEKLEESVAGTGDLSGVVRIREEVASIKGKHEVTAHSDKELVRLRGIFQKSKAEIGAKLGTARRELVDRATAALVQEETRLTKAGKIEEALELREEREQMKLEYLSAGASTEVQFAEDPRISGRAEQDAAPPVEIPDEATPLVDNPFGSGLWLDSMTVAVAKQRIREPIVVGDRGKKKWPLIVVPPGSVWAGGKNGQIFLSAGKLLARQSQFDALAFKLDFASICYFIRCQLDDCRLVRGGVWWGGKPATKFYLENCLIRKSLGGPLMKAGDYGIRMEKCVMVGVDLPTMLFKDTKPENNIGKQWFRVERSRFVKCSIPVNFLMMTHNCVFEDCSFVDNAEQTKELRMPLEIVLYTSNCKSRIREPSETLKLVEKAADKLPGRPPPTEEEIVTMIER